MKNNYKRSLLLIQIEAILTSAVFAMPILNIFFAEEIGMSLAQVGMSQAVFTAAILLLNIPTGWLADRFSRKACNIAGDIIAGLGFLLYAFAQSFGDVIVAEIIVGVGLAFTQGADVGLLRAYCQKLHQSYAAVSARVAKLRPLAEMAAVAIGGVVGAHNPRLAIGLSAATFAGGAALSAFAIEAGERRVSDVHPLRDMARITKYALHGHPRLAWSIAAFATSREATHPAIWLLTPILLLAGVPVAVLGAGWMLNLAMAVVGAQLAQSYGERLAEWQRYALPMAVILAACAVLAIDINMFTIWFYGAFGLVRGWSSAVMPPIIQNHTPDDMQSTVSSVAGSMAQLLYIPLVLGIGALGDHSVQTAMLGNLLIFLPVCGLVGWKLWRFGRAG